MEYPANFCVSHQVHFSCTIQICRGQCPDQCSQLPGTDVINLYNNGDAYDGDVRKRRDVSEHVLGGTLGPATEKNQVGLNKAIHVVAPRDLSFPVEQEESQMALTSQSKLAGESQSICVPTYGFVISILFVCLACVFATMLTFGVMRRAARKNAHTGKEGSKSVDYKLPNLYEMIRVH